MDRESTGKAPFDAFISYSHAADGMLAPAVQNGLQRLARPWHRLRALRIFRDTTALSANPHLWTSIVSALDRSRFFILLASPDAAASRWVNREVEHWKATKDVVHLLPVLTEGGWVWDEDAQDFDWEQSTAVPPALKGVFTEEPRHVDLRWAREEAQLDLRNGAFRDAIAAQLAAPLHGRDKDELVGDDIRQHRQTMRLARAAVATLVVLLAAAVVAAVLAVGNANRAERNATQANSRALANAAVATLDAQPEVGALLALEAHRLAPTVEARGAIVDAVHQTDGALARLPASGLEGTRDAQFSPSGDSVGTLGADQTVRLFSWRYAPAGPPAVRPAAALATTDTTALAVLSDERVAAAAEDGGVAVWDVPAKRVLWRPLAQDEGTVERLVRSRDGKLLAAVARRRAWVWDVATRRLVRSLTIHDGRLEGPVVILPGGRLLGSGTSTQHVGGVLFDWRTGTGEARIVPLPFSVVRSLAATADGRTLSIGLESGSIWIFDVTPSGLKGPHKRLEGSAAIVTDLEFAPGGSVMVAGRGDGRIELWNTKTWVTVGGSLTHGTFVSALAISPDGDALATAGSGGRVRVWDVSGRRRIGELRRTGYAAWGVDFSADGRRVAVAASTPEIVGKLEVVDLSAGQVTPLAAPGREPRYYFDVAFTRDQRHLVTASYDGILRLWDAGTGQVASVPGANGKVVTAVAASPTEPIVASGGADGGIRLWDSASLRRVRSLGSGEIQSLAFSPDGRRLAAISNEDVTLWEVASGRRLGLAHGTLAFDRGAVRFSPDGDLVATAGQGTVEFWRAPDLRRSGEPMRVSDQLVRGLAFTPDGRTLATASIDAALRFWDVRSHRPLGQPIRWARSGFLTAEFAPDGGSLATGADPGLAIWHALLWRQDLPAVRDRLCEFADRNLTRSEWEDFAPDLAYHRTCPQFPVTR